MDGLILAIDTATDIASVAVGESGEARSVIAVRGAREHAAQIMMLVDRALDAAGARAAHLSGLVVGDGPGSFTGLRIGWAAAKGLAHERGLTISAVPSLMAWAASAAAVVGSPIAACFDALRGQVFGAVYEFQRDRVETSVAPAVVTIEELARVAPVRPRLAVGDGAVLYADQVSAWTGAGPVGLERLAPAATSLLSLVTRMGATRELNEPLTAEPVYGRPAEAQAKWEARHGRPLPNPSRPGG
ncbi:MAG TPA: tRNA (adenosine(37)-N6)-threonylcarbamoyltransferase complex dimerization subunit type 1 TsaB [Gemmatimonadales bacterium]|nr:tRNA (adenosine(37)-N6)-threonylcarbamoyltransferase complex dimerization subunit type 1 TsaB [Gemmatimonadales bacterium]